MLKEVTVKALAFEGVWLIFVKVVPLLETST
jgi:hypothetical protein